MGRFHATVPFYARTRPPYDRTFFATVAARLRLCGKERLLDLGTGPGLLALGFAPFVSETVGVDPELAMLAAAREAAAKAYLPIRFIAGRAETLDPAWGPFDIVTIGRALHWMQPGPTCAALDRIIAADGIIAVCAASSVRDGRNAWLDAYDGARRPWTSRSPRLSGTAREQFFDGSRFSRIGLITVEQQRAVSVDVLADRVLSMSSSAFAIGDVAALRASVTAALEPFAIDGFVADLTVASAELYAAGRSAAPAPRG